MTPAERAARIAEQCATRIDRQIAREWWRVSLPNSEPIDVFMCPAATQSEVLARYPGAGVVAG